MAAGCSRRFFLYARSRLKACVKNIRRGAISTLHVWWARRPLVACRAAILGSLLRDPGNETERRRLLDFLVEYCTWEASNDSRMVNEARALIAANNGGRSPTILDCFAGGGAIPLEALRAGCEAHALELNPVAVLIELCTVVFPQKYGKPFELASVEKGLTGRSQKIVPNRLAFDVGRWGARILEETKKEVGSSYLSEEADETPLAYIWARTITCTNPTCNAQVPLLRQLWLKRKPKESVSLKLIPDKKTNSVRITVVKASKFDFDPSAGTMRYGSAECPVCKSGITRDYIKKASSEGKMGERMVAVVTSVKSSRKASEKVYREPTPFDQNLASGAKTLLENLKAKSSAKISLVPDEQISRDWPRTILPPLYGIKTWGGLFNSRQLLTLVTLAAKIRQSYAVISQETGDDEYAKAVITYLALALDRVADYCSTACRWHNTYEMIAGTFGRQAIPFVWDYAEVNPLTRTVGGWSPMIEAIVRVIEKWSAGQPCVVSQGTATKLPYDDSTFDAIITDPPYYSAVPYADLSDFFYVWLKRTIGPFYPELFSTPLTPKGPEIVEQMRHSSLRNRKDKAFFEREMTKALTEMNRVLKPEGICTVVFAHKTTTAWETLISALLSAGFSVSSSWPLHTEMRTRLRAHESAVLASSVWLVCRKRRPDSGVGSWKSVQAELDSRVKNRLDYFLNEGIRGADALLSAIGPALEVFGRYEKVEKVTGEVVAISEFLDKIREVVAHHALTLVLSEQELGRLDSDTAFYVLVKWTYEPRISSPVQDESQSREGNEDARPARKSKGLNGNHLAIPFDDALKLAHSVGAEVDTLIKTRLLEQENEYVYLLGPSERKDIHGLGEPSRDGSQPAVIDMIHKALNLWAGQERGALDAYLESSGLTSNDTFRRVAQALSNLLPLQSHEKQLLDGLLAHIAAGTTDREPARGTSTLDEYTGGKA